MDQYFSISNHKIFYTQWGKGSKLLLALHGFAHDHQMFNILKPGLQNEFTVIALDLPFHGQSKWRNKYYDRALIKTLVQQALNKFNRKKLSLMGFSLGARVWMASLYHIAPQVEGLYLLAPDGIKTKWVNWLEHIPTPVINLLKKSSENPERLIRFAGRLEKWHLINKFAKRFVQFHLKNNHSRERLFGTWRSIRFFKVNKKELAELVLQYRIQLIIVVGKKDPLLSIVTIKRLVSTIPTAELHLLNKTHSLIDGSVATLITKKHLLE